MNKVSELKQHIKTLEDEIRSIQEECSHDKIVYKYKSDTGNYDPSWDSYWVEVDCLCCDKHMHIDSEIEPLYYCSFKEFFLANAKKAKGLKEDRSEKIRFFCHKVNKWGKSKRKLNLKDYSCISNDLHFLLNDELLDQYLV